MFFQANASILMPWQNGLAILLVHSNGCCAKRTSFARAELSARTFIVNRSWQYYFGISNMVLNFGSTTHPLISLDAVQVRLVRRSPPSFFPTSLCPFAHALGVFFIKRSLKSFCVTFYSIFMVLSCFPPISSCRRL